MKEYLWTRDGCRLQYQSSYQHSKQNWLFLPGGPGLGSESLAELTELLNGKIPGAIWHVDLPNDGSNILPDKPISSWKSVLLQAIAAFENVILVAHSSLGMFAQTMPELEKLLHGLVLMGSAPDASWQKRLAEYVKDTRDKATIEAEKDYINHASNESLRNLLILEAKNCFISEKSLIKGKDLIKRLPINHSASEEAAKNFDSENYQATWIPEKINTLIINGSNDLITPIDLFINNPRYQRKNILIKEIPAAGHYSWFENPSAVVAAFQAFAANSM